MNKIKGYVSLMLVAVLMLGTLTACGGKKAEQADTKEPEVKEQVQTETKKEDEGPFAMYEPQDKTYTIEWLASHSNAPVPEDAEMVQYWEEKYNVDLVMWYIERSKWHEILNVKLASNEMPDILTVDDVDILRKYYDQDLIKEVPNDLVDHFMPKISAQLDVVAEKEGVTPWIVTNIDGTNYGIPKVNPNGQYHNVSVWRKDWLENVGITKTPETIEEYEEAFYKFVENDPDQNGSDDTYALSSGYQKAGGFSSIYGAFGFLPTYWSMKDGEMAYGAVQPEMKQALAKLAKWYKDGLINPEFITGENRGGHWSISHDFIEGKVGYTNSTPYYHIAPPGVYGSKGGKFYRTMAKTVDDMDTVVSLGRPPVGPNGESGDVRWGLINKEALVFKKEIEPDKLGKLLFMVEDMCSNFDNFTTANYGIEGKHYEKVDGAYKYTTEEGVPVEEYGLGNPLVAWAGGFEFENEFRPKQYAFGKEHATYSNQYSNQLFSSLPSKDMYWDELDKIQKEAYIRIITGDKPVDYFDEFVDQWYKLGGEQLVQEANEWYTSVMK